VASQPCSSSQLAKYGGNEEGDTKEEEEEDIEEDKYQLNSHYRK